MILRSLIFAGLIMICVGCSSTQIFSTPPVSPTATPILPSATPTAINSACALKPDPEVTPMVRPTFTPLPTQTPVITGRSLMIDTTFKSQLLNRTVPIMIYLPPGYTDSDRRYPTLYLLGGFSGDYREWSYWGICQALETLIRYGKIQPMIVVMPEGDHSYWFNHAAVPGSDGLPWGDYIWKEVVAYADANYRTLPQRASRAIGGLSAGGQGALMLGLTHPEIFSIVGAHSPSVRGADGSLAFFGTPDYFKQYDPQWLFTHTTTWKQLAIWIDVGHEDTQWGGVVVQWHQALVTFGIPIDYTDTWHGIHEDSYWSAHLNDYLQWYSSKLVNH